MNKKNLVPNFIIFTYLHQNLNSKFFPIFVWQNNESKLIQEFEFFNGIILKLDKALCIDLL